MSRTTASRTCVMRTIRQGYSNMLQSDIIKSGHNMNCVENTKIEFTSEKKTVSLRIRRYISFWSMPQAVRAFAIDMGIEPGNWGIVPHSGEQI